MVKTRTSEPHSPHQNPAEPEWGRLAKMVQNCLRAFNAPIELSNWCALHCCQVNNHASRGSLNNKTPLEVSTGVTPDVSHFRFHFYEPIWYFDPKIKIPKNNLLKARYLALAESCGDAMTYYILTEPDLPKAKRQVLMRSVIKTRRQNIGTTAEYVNSNPATESFTLSLSETATNTAQHTQPDPEVPLLIPGEKIAIPFDSKLLNEANGEDESSDEEDTVTEDAEETLPDDLGSTNDAESHREIVETVDPNVDGDLNFRKIVDHNWSDGILIFKAQYLTEQGTTYTLDTPWKKLKQDELVSCAKYIREYIMEDRSNRL